MRNGSASKWRRRSPSDGACPGANVSTTTATSIVPACKLANRFVGLDHRQVERHLGKVPLEGS